MFAEEIIRFQAQKRNKLNRRSYYVNPLKRALKYQAILDKDPSLNKAKLAKKLGTSRVRVTQLLGLLKLPEEIQDRILDSTGISERSLRPLINIQNREALEMEFEALIEANLSR